MVSKEEVMFECKKNNRVCPMPIKWNELYQLLPGVQPHDSDLNPPRPLILAAWYTPPSVKQYILQKQIQWAEDHGNLDEIYSFLTTLDESDWLHLRD